jgi:four helix bundle protein
VLKELNETDVWLQLIAETALLPVEITNPIVAETQELCRIIAASIRTALEITNKPKGLRSDSRV